MSPSSRQASKPNWEKGKKLQSAKRLEMQTVIGLDWLYKFIHATSLDWIFSYLDEIMKATVHGSRPEILSRNGAVHRV